MQDTNLEECTLAALAQIRSRERARLWRRILREEVAPQQAKYGIFQRRTIL